MIIMVTFINKTREEIYSELKEHFEDVCTRRNRCYRRLRVNEKMYCEEHTFLINGQEHRELRLVNPSKNFSVSVMGMDINCDEMIVHCYKLGYIEFRKNGHMVGKTTIRDCERCKVKDVFGEGYSTPQLRIISFA